MEGPDLALFIGTITIVAVLIALAAGRFSSIASWRSATMITASTGALEADVDVIWYDERLQPNDWF